jgi:integrase
MAVYRTTYTDKKTGKQKQSRVWWYEFIYDGRRYRESAKTTRKSLAREAEERRKLELQRKRAGGGNALASSQILRTIKEAVTAYAQAYDAPNHSAGSIEWANRCSRHVMAHLGSLPVVDVDNHAILGYMRTRDKEGASKRTINMEILTLARAMGRTWRELWPAVPKLDEPSDTGQALAPEQEGRILGAAMRNKSRYVEPVILIALSSGMRLGEILHLKLDRLDMKNRELRVGKAKTSSGEGRGIPMNPAMYAAVSKQIEWLEETFGKLDPSWYLFPFSDRVKPIDPTRPVTTIKTAWNSVRKAAGVKCRFHDLRHTAATKMAENDVPEATMKALLGHMSQKMIERYSHIRNEAKRQAVDGLTLATPVFGILQEVPKVIHKPLRKAAGK